MEYSKTCVKLPLLKRSKIGFQVQLSLNAGQKYCRMLQGEHSEILLTFIKLPFVIKIFVLSVLIGNFTQVLLYSTFLSALIQKIRPYPAAIFCSEMLSAFYICCIYLMLFRLDFFMEANNINLDQTALKEGPYCLQYRLPKKTRWETTKVVTGGLKVTRLTIFSTFVIY